jgi:hypothetical protein
MVLAEKLNGKNVVGTAGMILGEVKGIEVKYQYLEHNQHCQVKAQIVLVLKNV